MAPCLGSPLLGAGPSSTEMSAAGPVGPESGAEPAALHSGSATKVRHSASNNPIVSHVMIVTPVIGYITPYSCLSSLRIQKSSSTCC